MASWAEFESAAPELAVAARDLLYRDGSGKALLATVHDDEPPFINPISVGIVDGELVAFIFRSGKLTALRADGRYALHGHLDLRRPHELLLRGRAREVIDADRRASAIAVWPFEPDDGYHLFGFDIETVTIGRRESANEWPPRYTRWRA